MKVKELKEAIKDIGFHNDINLKVTEDIYAFYIESKNKTLAIVSKSEKCLIGINYQNFSEQEEKLRQTLFDVIYEFASTPPEERQEEKKYYLRHKFLDSLQTNYLNFSREIELFKLSTLKHDNNKQTQFTMGEIDEIKEKFDTDLKDFEIIEVEEWTKENLKIELMKLLRNII